MASTGLFDDVLAAPPAGARASTGLFDDVLPAGPLASALEGATPAAEIDRSWGEVVTDAATGIRRSTRNITSGWLGAPVNLVNALTATPRRLAESSLSGANALRDALGMDPIEAGFEIPVVQQPDVVRGMQESIALTNEADAADNLSAKAQAQAREFQEADGLVEVMRTLAANPSFAGTEAVAQLPQLALNVVPGSMAGSIGLGSVSAGAQNADQVAAELRAQGLTEDEIGANAAEAFAASTVLNLAANLFPAGRALERVVGGGAGRTAARTPGRALASALVGETVAETGTEAGDQLIQNLATGQPWDTQLAQAGVLGALLGAPSGAAAGTADALALRQAAGAPPAAAPDPAAVAPAPAAPAAPDATQAEVDALLLANTGDPLASAKAEFDAAMAADPDPAKWNERAAAAAARHGVSPEQILTTTDAATATPPAADPIVETPEQAQDVLAAALAGQEPAPAAAPRARPRLAMDDARRAELEALRTTGNAAERRSAELLLAAAGREGAAPAPRSLVDAMAGTVPPPPIGPAPAAPEATAPPSRLPESLRAAAAAAPESAPAAPPPPAAPQAPAQRADGQGPKLYQQGNRAQAFRDADGAWFTRYRKAGQWQEWRARPEGFDPSGMGYRDTDGRVRIPGRPQVVVGTPAGRAPRDDGPADLLQQIARGRGLDREAWRAEGVDPAQFTERRGGYVFRKSGGMTPEDVREMLQQDGFLPQDDPDAPPVVGNDDAVDLVMRALQGERIFNDADAGAVVERQAAEREAEDAARDEELARDLGFADAGAMYAEIDRADSRQADREAAGFTEADFGEALALGDLVQRAIDAGVEPGAVTAATWDASPEDQADALWRLIEEVEGGSDAAAATRGDRGGAAPRGPGAGVESTRPRYDGPGGLLPPPTAREEVDAAGRARDDARNGRTGTGDTSMRAGAGDLFAGRRPEQTDLANAQPDPTRQAYEDFVARALRRQAMDERGQEILETLIDEEISPNDVLRQFWRETYFRMPAEVQQRFQRLLGAHTGMEPGSVISVDRNGERTIAEDWVQIADQGTDLPQFADELEGTDRGFVVLMHEANQRFPAGSVRSDAPRYADTTDTPAFRRWFGDSKVVDAQGNPRVMYHGTTANFDAFNEGTGWFTADPAEANFWGGMNADGANLVPAYLAITNPRILQASEASKQSIYDALALLRADQDGVLVMENGEIRWAVVDRPEQIKSATGNDGGFDPSNPSIVRSDAPQYVRRGFDDYLADDRGQARDFLTESAAREEADRVGGEVRFDEQEEGRRPGWGVVRSRSVLGEQLPRGVESQNDLFVRTRGDAARAPAEPAQAAPPLEIKRPRPDASERLTRRADNAIRRLVERNRGSVLVDTLARDFRDENVARLIGQRVESAQDLAALASVYRNPIFETLRYVFVDGAGNVLGETAISDRMPASAVGWPDSVTTNSYNADLQVASWLDDIAPEGTTGVWLMHNHPSGDPSPSDADQRFTATVSALLEKGARAGMKRVEVKGHVILNHQRFAALDRRGQQIRSMHQDGMHRLPGEPTQDPLRKRVGPDLSDKRTVRKVGGEFYIAMEETAAQGKAVFELTDRNSLAFIAVDARGRVALATAFDPEVLRRDRRAPAIINQLATRSGGMQVNVVGDALVIAGLRDQLFALAGRGIINDVISVSARDGVATAQTFGPLGTASSSKRRRNRSGESDPRVNAKRPQYLPDQEAALTKAGMGYDGRTIFERSRDRLAEEWAKVRGAFTDTDALKQAAFDRFHGIRAAEARMPGIAAEDSPYLAARLTTGLPSIMEALNLFGAPEWRDGVLSIKAGTEGLLDVLKPVADDLDAWLGWMVGRRAELLKQQGRENLFDDTDIAALLSLAKGKEQRFRTAAAGYLKIKNAVLTVAEEAGLIDPAQRAAWDHAEYIPFYRQEGDRALGPGTRAGLAGQSSGVRTLKGGEANLADPLGNIMRNFTKLIDASLKNRAMLLAIDQLDQAMFTKKGPEFSSALIPMDQVKKQLLAQGVPQTVIAGMPAGALKGVQKMFSLVPPTGDDVVRVMRDGKAEYYQVADPLVLRALTAFKERSQSWAVKPFVFAKRLLTTGVTATAEFVSANVIRDTASTWMIGGNVRLGYDAAVGAVQTLRRDKLTREMMMAGGSFIGGNFYGGDQDAIAAAQRRALRARGMSTSGVNGIMATIATSPKILWDKWMELSSAVENANRHAVMAAALRDGKPRAQAIFEAKDLMDFSMQGDSSFMQFFSDVLPFFNARVQGLYRLGRGVADPKQRGRILARGGMLALASTALWAWNQAMHAEAYDELEEWDKDTYWHVAPGTPYHVRIPKPFELGLLFGTAPERMAQAVAGNDRGDQSMAALLRAITGTLAINPIPQGVLPIVEQWANRRFFTGRPIENMGDEKLLPEAREEWYSSDTMKLIADATGNTTGLSAKRLEHLWNGYTGGLGGYVLDTADAAVRAITGAPERPELSIRDLPVVGRFARGADPSSSRYVTEFYELRERAQQVGGTIKEYRETGKMERADRLYRENAWLLGPIKKSSRAKGGILFENLRAMDKLANRLGEERREGEALAASDASAAAKREGLNEITADRNAEMKKMVRRLREAERR